MIAQAAESLFLESALRYGPLGLIIVAAALGLVWFRPAVDQIRQALDLTRADLLAAREDLRRNQELLQAIVPAVTQTAASVQRLSEELLWRKHSPGAA